MIKQCSFLATRIFLSRHQNFYLAVRKPILLQKKEILRQEKVIFSLRKKTYSYGNRNLSAGASIWLETVYYSFIYFIDKGEPLLWLVSVASPLKFNSFFK